MKVVNNVIIFIFNILKFINWNFYEYALFMKQVKSTLLPYYSLFYMHLYKRLRVSDFMTLC